MSWIRKAKRALGRFLIEDDEDIKNFIFEDYVKRLAAQNRRRDVDGGDPSASTVPVDWVIDTPDLLRSLMQSPRVFEVVIGQAARNPEFVYRIFSERHFRNRLTAQTEFLESVAEQDSLMDIVVAAVPSSSRARFAVALAKGHHAVAAALLADPELKERVGQLLSEDVDAVASLTEQAALLPSRDDPAKPRVGDVLRAIFGKSAVASALRRDPELARSLAGALERAAGGEAGGERSERPVGT